ncbi:MAG: glycerate kinase [Paucimonas sp.]|nr:glycerate kinase [Paucimonas sp.]
MTAQSFLEHLFKSALAEVGANKCLAGNLPEAPRGKTVVVGAGKAAAAMARQIESQWQGELSGLVVTRYGHAVPCTRIEVVEAAHPVPDAAGQDAAHRILQLVRGLDSEDLVLCLMSGGGSSLLSMAPPGLTLDDKQAVNRALLKSGAAIGEINCVRKHLSAIKGGLISDVPGDDPAVIASGPTLPDTTTCDDALAILAKYAIPVSTAVRDHLESGRGETPKPGDERFASHSFRVVASAKDALEAAAAAVSASITPHILSDRVEGEARDVARIQAELALRIAEQGKPFARPCVLLSGGETTVTLRGKGRGGRNTEFLLSLAIALGGHERIHALACDTDGIDGSENNAGAICGPDTLKRAAVLGLDAQAMLDDNDAYGFFGALGDLVTIGPTLTNVNDFRAILIL